MSGTEPLRTHSRSHSHSHSRALPASSSHPLPPPALPSALCSLTEARSRVCSPPHGLQPGFKYFRAGNQPLLSFSSSSPSPRLLSRGAVKTRRRGCPRRSHTRARGGAAGAVQLFSTVSSPLPAGRRQPPPLPARPARPDRRQHGGREQQRLVRDARQQRQRRRQRR